jgi:hypothetical protein
VPIGQILLDGTPLRHREGALVLRKTGLPPLRRCLQLVFSQRR